MLMPRRAGSRAGASFGAPLPVGIFDPREVTATLDAHVARREDLSRPLWGLICFSLWLEGAAASRPAPLQAEVTP